MNDGDAINILAELEDMNKNIDRTNALLTEINDRAEETARISFYTRIGIGVLVLVLLLPHLEVI